MFRKINQRGITWKIRKEEQLFLIVTYHCYLIHIPIKFFNFYAPPPKKWWGIMLHPLKF